MSETYLDYAATAPMLPVVRDRMCEVMSRLSSDQLGNPSALHTPGQRAAAILDDARAAVAELIGAQPSEIIFTSGGSEANNTVMALFAGQPIAVSAVEHPSVTESARAAASQLSVIPVDVDGRVRVADLPSGQALISIMLANNELGTIEPVADLCAASKAATQVATPATSAAGSVTPAVAAPSRFHTDATQAVGKIPVDAHALGVDYLTLSAHKLGGPVGIGALYVKSGSPFRPLIRGGHQENGRRAGTSNVLLAAGFAVAARAAQKNLAVYQTSVQTLRDELRRRILATVPYSSCNSPAVDCLPNILNVSFRAAEGESIQLYLDAAGIIVSTGSACASGSLDPSPVIMATRHDAEIAHSSIRFSLGPATTSADLDRVMAVLPDIIKRLQSISTIKLDPRKESHASSH